MGEMNTFCDPGSLLLRPTVCWRATVQAMLTTIEVRALVWQAISAVVSPLRDFHACALTVPTIFRGKFYDVRNETGKIGVRKTVSKGASSYRRE